MTWINDARFSSRHYENVLRRISPFIYPLALPLSFFRSFERKKIFSEDFHESSRFVRTRDTTLEISEMMQFDDSYSIYSIQEYINEDVSSKDQSEFLFISLREKKTNVEISRMWSVSRLVFVLFFRPGKTHARATSSSSHR